MESVMKAVKEELGEKTNQVNLITVNLDKTENHPLGAEYQIRVVPTIFFIDKNDEVVNVVQGGLVKEDVLAALKDLGVE